MNNHHHPITGEIITCKICIKPCKVFVSGLYPLCDSCAQKYESLKGDIFDRLSQLLNSSGG